MWRQKITLIITLIGTILASGCMNQSWQRGQKHIAHGRYLLALEALEEAQRTDPKLNENPEFVADFERTRKKCSRIHYKEALDKADVGSLQASINALKRAIELDPNNTDAETAMKYALSTPPSEISPGLNRLVQLTTETNKNIRQKRWEMH